MNSLDASFDVPFVHRLRFTRDVLTSDSHVLTDLMETSPDQVARAQFWVDQQVLAARPDLPQRIRRLMAPRAAHLELVGNVQVVPGGEEVKNDIHVLERVLKVLNAADLDRRSYVVVIGGGAVLDAIGFATSIAHRGLRLIRLPTTTLAQADSGIGVKNAVNLFHKKNWIGTFSVPWGVINDVGLLKTLPDRDYRCGFAEAVKVALLKDRQFFEEIAQQTSVIAARDTDTASSVIARSAEWHLRHITQAGDPFEFLEARPLDFGHWSAHKLEALTKYELRHGEAVAIGLAIDTVYSHLQHGLPESEVHAILSCLRQLGFDLDHPLLHNTDLLFAGLEEFRQHLGGRLTLTMLQRIGQPVDIHEVDLKVMTTAIAQLSSDRANAS
ncbi:MAG: 3-dehydroquinate synthase [Pirellulaceae bacterium]|nr:3-dehydroquinate synthase [Pirellulaceae bacterium]